MTINITPELLEHIKKVIDYVESDESEHYDNCEEDERTNHIYNHIKPVSNWLEEVS